VYHKIYHGSILKGGIRNDHISKRTYFICLAALAWQCPSHFPEKILYDFGAGIGDTIFWSTCGTEWVVTGFDSILLLDGKYRKRFVTNYGRVIEGIGSEGSPLCGPCDGMFCLDLLCFKQDTSYLISNTPSTYNPLFPYGCGPLASLSEIGPSQLDVIIFPNPSRGLFSISSSQEALFVEILDVFGKVVLNSVIKTPKEEFNISSKPKGIYFVKVMDDKGNFGVKKIILQ
jgi:hypothetical protein